MGDGSADNTDGEAMKVSYAYGSNNWLTVTTSTLDATAATSDDTTSFAVTYTLPVMKYLLLTDLKKSKDLVSKMLRHGKFQLLTQLVV